MYDAVVICRNADGTYQLAYDDGDEERAVPADLIFNADEPEEDWYDDYNELRRFAAGSMMRKIVITQVRTRQQGCWWHWRRCTEMRMRMAQRNASKLLGTITAMTGGANSQKTQLLRLVSNWICSTACNRVHQASVSKFKSDYSTLAAHIHVMEEQFDRVRVGSALSKFQNTVAIWVLQYKSHAMGCWARATCRSKLHTEVSQCQTEAQQSHEISVAEQDKLRMQLNRATRERIEALEELEELQRHARATIQEVQHLRAQLGAPSGDELGLPVKRSPSPHQSPPKPRAGSSRFQAFSAYSASLMADPGFDS